MNSRKIVVGKKVENVYENVCFIVFFAYIPTIFQIIQMFHLFITKIYLLRFINTAETVWLVFFYINLPIKI